MLPNTIAEFFAPGDIGIKALYMLIIELIESLLGGNSFRNKNKIQTVHQPPVFIESSLILYCVPERRSGKRREFGHVHIVQPKRYDKIGSTLDGFFRFARQAHHE